MVARLRRKFWCVSILIVFILLSWSAFSDQVVILNTPQDRAQARIDSLRNADEVLEVVYLMNEDTVGLEKLALLRQKAREGAQVKLLVDAHGCALSQNMIQNLMKDPTLEGRFQIKLFNALDPKHIIRNRNRMHSKLQITTAIRTGNTVAIGGGSNLRDEYYGLGEKPFTDSDLYVSGQAAKESRIYFLTLWNSNHSKTATGMDNIRDYWNLMKDIGRSILFKPQKQHATPDGIAQAGKSLDAAYEDLENNKVIHLSKEGRWKQRLTEVGPVSFYHDNFISFQGSHTGILEMIKKAQSSIRIENPYVIFSPDFRTELRNAIARGVDVEIITSWKHSDGNLVRAAIKLESKWMNANGIKFYEYEPSSFLHRKTIVVDKKWVGLGSYNLDPRSQYLNHEIFYVFENQQVAAEMTKRFEVDRSFSKLITKPSQLRFKLGCEYVLQGVATFLRRDL